MTDRTKRHILIVVENLPVPLDRRVWLEATTLKQAGYDVSVICPMGRGWTARHEVIEGVHIHRHTEPPEAHSGAVAYAREYGHAIRHWFRLAGVVWKRRPFDVIQGCNPPDLIFLLALWYRLWGVRYMFDHHDVCPELFEAKFGKKGLLYRVMLIWERLTFATASVSMATNGSFRDIAIRRGQMDPDDVFVVRSAPRIENFIPGPGNPDMRKGAGTVMGYVGVIGQQEGMDLLVLAADHLIRKLGRTDVHFLIVGFGPHLEEVQRDVAAHALEDHFTFTGALYGEDLLAALNVIDIGVSPDPKNAMNDISTMNKVMEYMTLEKPVVQFDLTEGRVSAGNAGLYACANDPIDFAKKIAQLMDDPNGRARMGAMGRKRVLNDLSWTHTEPQLLAAYDRIYAKMGRQ
ncbi:Glycosyltransferase involved in cell wall bisynthesis [Loktanella atrilutea]|uniref:Glycosyltransferase involved in cell wall bisynthesis n=1 Tax=Loktanella atrilutea TaxID=366533 RepID=A0A1M5F588_LOKAT|nr:glycosyltransferase family 4 protein [Loktanella atrilutea]SHF86709.1 Glycosyltransferase involved in cell wall bisynthesis [Loktanella atrilutea]